MPARFLCQEHDRLVLDGVAYRFVLSDDVVHRFEDADRPSRTLALTDADLAKRASSPGYRYTRGWYAPAQVVARAKSGVDDLHELEPSEVARVLHRLAVCEGYLKREADGLNTRSDASMTAALEAMFAAAVREATGEGIGKDEAKPKASDTLTIRKMPCSRTLRTWLSRLAEGGNAMALRPRHFRAGDRSPRFDPDVCAAMEACVEDYMTLTRPTLAACHLLLDGRVEAINDARGLSADGRLACPSIAALARAVRGRGPFAVYAARHGLEAANVKFKPRGQGADATRAGERIEIDEWRVKLQIILVALNRWHVLTKAQRKAAKRVRVWLCAAVDAASRCCLGLSLSFTACTANALAALSMVIRDKTPLARSHGAVTPWDMCCNPEEVYSDSGSSFRGDGFRKALVGLGAARVVLAAGQPKLRGRNERFFRTTHNRTFAWTPGRTFSNPLDKGRYDAEANASVTLSSLGSLLILSVCDIYHNLPHDGLGGETPRNAWKRLTSQCRVIPLPGADHARDVFGTPVEREVGSHGVRVLGIDYSSDELQRQWRSHHLGGVEVRLDPFDLGQVSVRVPSGWITCPCRSGNYQGVPLTAWVDMRRDLARIHGADAKLTRPVVLRAVREMRALIAEDARKVGLDELRPAPSRSISLRRISASAFCWGPSPATTGTRSRATSSPPPSWARDREAPPGWSGTAGRTRATLPTPTASRPPAAKMIHGPAPV